MTCVGVHWLHVAHHSVCAQMSRNNTLTWTLVVKLVPTPSLAARPAALRTERTSSPSENAEKHKLPWPLTHRCNNYRRDLQATSMKIHVRVKGIIDKLLDVVSSPDVSPCSRNAHTPTKPIFLTLHLALSGCAQTHLAFLEAHYSGWHVLSQALPLQV